MSDTQGYPGARALMALHENELRAFLAEWKTAKAHDVRLPATDDPAYRSLETLLAHVLSCAGRYIAWAAEALERPVPTLPDLPAEDRLEAEADELLDAVLDAWRIPLWEHSLEDFTRGGHEAWWGTEYCIDAMLEHAVMHPLRHRWQLTRLRAGE